LCRASQSATSNSDVVTERLTRPRLADWTPPEMLVPNLHRMGKRQSRRFSTPAALLFRQAGLGCLSTVRRMNAGNGWLDWQDWDVLRVRDIMRATTITLTLVGFLFTGVFSLSLAQPTQPVPWHPCAQITAACTQAGFVPYGAKLGVGIAVDCIKPIMAGTPQRKQATKPLPLLDPQVVVACKERNPNFGMDGEQPLFAFRTSR